MNKPLVSILIPSYNAEKTIKRCIECAINQTYENIEILIIDDCSKDNTTTIIKSFNDNRIKFYSNKINLGMSENWNECIRKSNGEFIHYLHCDDIINNNCIELKVNEILKDNDINLVFSPTLIIDENDKTVLSRKYFKKSQIFNGNQLAHKSFLFANIFGEPSNVLFRKEILDVTGLFSNTKYSTDWELWIKISSLGKCAYISNYLTKYRVSKTNLTSKYNFKDVINDDKMMIENIKEFKYLKLSNIEIIIHRINIYFRTIARKIYLSIIN